MADPRKVGSSYYHGVWGVRYTVLWRDGPDWRVEYENGTRGTVCGGWWRPDLGDRSCVLVALDSAVGCQLDLFGSPEDADVSGVPQEPSAIPVRRRQGRYPDVLGSSRRDGQERRA